MLKHLKSSSTIIVLCCFMFSGFSVMAKSSNAIDRSSGTNSCCLSKCRNADMVLMNGFIYTGVNNEVVQSVAIKDGKICAVGSNKCIRKFIGKNTQVIDLDGKMTLPGFVESHSHPSYVTTVVSVGVDVSINEDGSIATSGAEILANIKRFADENPELEFILGYNYNRALFQADTGNELAPTALDLDTAVPDRPSAIFEQNGHSYWINSPFIALLDLDVLYPFPTQPANGLIERYSAGDPLENLATGQLDENALTLVTNALPILDKALFQETYLGLLAFYNSLGITTLFDAMNTGYATISVQKAYQDYVNELAQTEQLTCRVRASWYINPADLSEAALTPAQQIALAEQFKNEYNDPNKLFRVNTVKFFVDGILEGGQVGTALLLEPYCDTFFPPSSCCNCTTNYKGLDFWANSDLTASMRQANKADLQIHVHTIGDGAAKRAIDSLQSAGVSKKMRPAMAHLQLISDEYVAKMAQLGVTASVTPVWPVVDIFTSAWYYPRLGFDRMYHAQYPFQSMFDLGINVATGSDFPVALPEYNQHTFTGMTRLLSQGVYDETYGDEVKFPYTTDLAHTYSFTDFPQDLVTEPIPVGPLKPNLGDPDDERIYPLDRLLASYTRNTAKQILLECEIGTIEVGKSADIVVWDTNWFPFAKRFKATNNVQDLEPVANSAVDLTIFRGAVVYSNLPEVKSTAKQKNSQLRSMNFSKLRMPIC